ncbi:MAG: endonuclease V [Chloroflexi bacterium]|nr:endonuclease V [Chloroflexota bacterium]
MKLDQLHNWNLDPKSAIALQSDLATKLISDIPLALNSVETVAGVDVSVRRGLSRAAVVIMRYPQLEVVEIACAERKTTFPYIPGLLAFREGPVILEALGKLRSEPDAYIFDGMGQIHPRRMGIAAHLGLWLGRPSLGCGKSHYIGEYAAPADAKGSSSAIRHRDEQIGVALRTRTKVKLVYVSAGHLIDLESAVRLTLSLITRYRLPEPIRAAHRAASLPCS